MPPKSKKGKRFKDPKYHYNEAYRPQIKAARPAWRAGEITSTLNWMWKYRATDGERAECQRLYDEYSEEVMLITAATSIPDEVKKMSDPAPTPADEAEEAVEMQADEAPAEVNAPVEGTTPAEVIAPAEVNTTAFPFWPESTAHINLPAIDHVDAPNMKRDLYTAGFHHEAEEADEKRWKGVHLLGCGSSAMASLWIKRDDHNNIERTMAVRDVKTIERRRWTSPFNWRDRLPKELAIQERLNEHEGYDHNIHRYFGYRLDLAQRRYRVYNEVCELGDLWHCMKYYAKPWRTRRNLQQWNEAHPELSIGRAKALKGRDDGEMCSDSMHSKIEKERVAAWEEYAEAKARRVANRDSKAAGPKRKKARKVKGRRGTSKEFDDMLDIEQDAGRPLGPGPDSVIPEDFLWHVFDSLVNALIILHQGNQLISEGKPWKEIVHRDIHSGNILIKLNGEKEGRLLPQNEVDEEEEGMQNRAFEPDEYPSILLADWDFAFFDLQSAPNDYQDNPYHYNLGPSPGERGSRYPPEMYEDHVGFQAGEKLTSKTDVFGIGQIMWNTLMNFPERHQAPFYDDNGTDYTCIVNGSQYEDSTLDESNGVFLSGTPPWDASSRYSRELRQLASICLKYSPENRPSVLVLKESIEKFRKEKPFNSAPGPLILRVESAMGKFRVNTVYDSTDEEGPSKGRADEPAWPGEEEDLGWLGTRT